MGNRGRGGGRSMEGRRGGYVVKGVGRESNCVFKIMSHPPASLIPGLGAAGHGRGGETGTRETGRGQRRGNVGGMGAEE